MSDAGHEERCVHASTVALGGRAVLICGPSGAGKSDLALMLLDRGFTLVSDDQTRLRRDGGRLIASPPPAIAGKIEVRGLGIVEVDAAPEAPVALAIELGGAIERMPEPGRTTDLLGLGIPTVTIDPRSASAAAKAALALDRLGLRW